MIDVDVGMTVINNRNEVKGTIVKMDSESIFIDVPGIGIKTVTIGTFNKWWKLEKDVEDISQDVVDDEELLTKEVEAKAGVGEELSIKFISIIKSYNDDEIVMFFKNPKKFFVKCMGRNIFEVTICRKKLVVMAHPNSLTPDNMRRVTKLYPKEWNNSLRAKFVFQSVDQVPLMKTIISDGIFYRKNI